MWNSNPPSSNLGVGTYFFFIDDIRYRGSGVRCQGGEIINFKKIATNITRGASRCQTNKEYGNIYYEPEEIAFLNIARNTNIFYNQFLIITARTS